MSTRDGARRRLKIVGGVLVLLIVMGAPAVTATLGFVPAAVAEAGLLFVASLVAIWAVAWRRPAQPDSRIVAWLRVYLPILDGYLRQREEELEREHHNQMVVARMQHAMAFYGVGTLDRVAVDTITGTEDRLTTMSCAREVARLLTPTSRPPPVEVLAALYRDQWKEHAPDEWTTLCANEELLRALAAVVVDSGRLPVAGHGPREIEEELRKLRDLRVGELRAGLASRPTDRAGELSYIIGSKHDLGSLDQNKLTGAAGGAGASWYCRQAAHHAVFRAELAGEDRKELADLVELLWRDWKGQATSHLWKRRHVRRLLAMVLPWCPQLPHRDPAVIRTVLEPVQRFSLALVEATLSAIADLDRHLEAFATLLDEHDLPTVASVPDALELLAADKIGPGLPAGPWELAGLRSVETTYQALAEAAEPAIRAVVGDGVPVEELTDLVLVAVGCYADGLGVGGAELRRHACTEARQPHRWRVAEIVGGHLALAEEAPGVPLGHVFREWQPALAALGDRQRRVVADVDLAFASERWPRRLTLTTDTARDEMHALVEPLGAKLDRLASELPRIAEQTSWSAATSDYQKQVARVLADFQTHIDDRFGSVLSHGFAEEFADVIRPGLADLHHQVESLGHPSHEELLTELRRHIAALPSDVEPTLAPLASRLRRIEGDLDELKRLDTLKAMLARRGGGTSFDGYLITFDARQGPLARLIDCLSHPTSKQRKTLNKHGIAPPGVGGEPRYNFTNYTRYARQGHPPEGLGTFDTFREAFEQDVELLLCHRDALVGTHDWSEIEVTLIPIHVSDAVPFTSVDDAIAALLRDPPSIAEFPAA